MKLDRATTHKMKICANVLFQVQQCYFICNNDFILLSSRYSLYLASLMHYFLPYEMHRFWKKNVVLIIWRLCYQIHSVTYWHNTSHFTRFRSAISESVIPKVLSSLYISTATTIDFILTVFLARMKSSNGNSVNVHHALFTAAISEGILQTFSCFLQVIHTVLNNRLDRRLHCNPRHHHVCGIFYK